MDLSVKVAVIYYSATGNVAELARELTTAAEKAGAEVRLRRVAELATQVAIDANPAWKANVAVTADIPVATPADIIWADAVIMGTPTRFGNVSSPLKAFIDSLGPAWFKGRLADKVYSAFTSSGTIHGGNEATLLALNTSFHHFGGIVVAPGYTHPDKFADGNPYGTSHCDGRGKVAVDEVALAAARVQAARVVRYARALVAAG
jgi:NAD(P)H dehydrogenase (quinone)